MIIKLMVKNIKCLKVFKFESMYIIIVHKALALRENLIL